MFQSQKVNRQELWSEAPLLRDSAEPLQQLHRASAQGRVPVRGRRVQGLQLGSWRCCQGSRAGPGWCPWAGAAACSGANLRLAGWGSPSAPPSLPPSLPPLPLSQRDPVQGGAIVTDTIPVRKPLQFVNKTSSMAWVRSLLNIYESFLQGGNYCKLQFPFTTYPLPR